MGDFGATQGGVQDMGFARELIANGQVPPPEAFSVEGMFSEHDLPLSGSACQTLLCLREALGLAPDLEGEASAWLQVGLSSTIDPEHFERPPITLIATVDVSGSMGWDYSDEETSYPRPGAITRALLRRVAAELGAGDRIGLVTYGSDVRVALGLTRADERERVSGAIDGLCSGGSTNMEAGLRKARDLARQALADGRRGQVRVMLLTDVQPNVGATSPSEFERIAADLADQGIGLTVMGVGLGMGQEVLDAMVNLRGGNAFSLFDHADVRELMDDSWPWMVCPIAYDLAVDLVPTEGIQIADAYGFPGQQRSSAGFQVASVFLSRRKGALLLRLTDESGLAKPDGLRVRGLLRYSTPAGERIAEQIEAVYYGQPFDERGMFFEQPSLARTVALAVLVSNMRLAAEHYATGRQAALDLMDRVVARIEADQVAQADPALEPEVQLARDLLALMQQGAPQGDLYGQR